MKENKRTKNNWPKQSSYFNNENDMSELQREMRRYAHEKTGSVRTARRFLRAVGLNINYDGYLLNNGKIVTLPENYAVFGE